MTGSRKALFLTLVGCAVVVFWLNRRKAPPASAASTATETRQSGRLAASPAWHVTADSPDRSAPELAISNVSSDDSDIRSSSDTPAVFQVFDNEPVDRNDAEQAYEDALSSDGMATLDYTREVTQTIDRIVAIAAESTHDTVRVAGLKCFRSGCMLRVTTSGNEGWTQWRRTFGDGAAGWTKRSISMRPVSLADGSLATTIILLP